MRNKLFYSLLKLQSDLHVTHEQRYTNLINEENEIILYFEALKCLIILIDLLLMLEVGYLNTHAKHS